MSPIGIVIAALTLTLGLVAFATSIRATNRARDVEEVRASVIALTTANEGLRGRCSDLELQLLSQRDEFRDRLHAQELECANALAEQRGKVDALTSGLAKQIVDAVVALLPRNS